MENLITIPKYASMQKMTQYKVLQQVRNGELETLVKEIDGKEVTFIVMPAVTEENGRTDEAAPEKRDVDYKEKYETLLGEYRELKARYDALLKTRF